MGAWGITNALLSGNYCARRRDLLSRGGEGCDIVHGSRAGHNVALGVHCDSGGTRQLCGIRFDVLGMIHPPQRHTPCATPRPCLACAMPCRARPLKSHAIIRQARTWPRCTSWLCSCCCLLSLVPRFRFLAGSHAGCLPSQPRPHPIHIRP